MAMSKQDFIALADVIKDDTKHQPNDYFTNRQIGLLADFCKRANSNFNRERWLAYIKGEVGSSGGRVKQKRDNHEDVALD